MLKLTALPTLLETSLLHSFAVQFKVYSAAALEECCGDHKESFIK